MIEFINDKVIMDKRGLSNREYEFKPRVAHVCPTCEGLIHAVVEYPYPKDFPVATGVCFPGTALLDLNKFAEPMPNYMVSPEYTQNVLADPVSRLRLLQFYDSVHFEAGKDRTYGRCSYNHVVVGGEPAAIATLRQLLEKIQQLSGMANKPEPLLAVAAEFPEVANFLLTLLGGWMHVLPDLVGGAYPLYLISKTRLDYTLLSILEVRARSTFPQCFAVDESESEGVTV